MNYLKFIRLNRGMRQDDLSMQSGIPQYRISRLERGAAQPTPDERKKLSQVLDISGDALDKRVEVRV